MVKKKVASILLTAFLLTSAPLLFAEGELSMELDISNILFETREVFTVPTLTAGDSYWAWLTAGSASFSFKSKGNTNVKADLAFSFTAPEMALTEKVVMPMLSLDRAFVKARFPNFRVTAGKTRLSWGDGFVFNSGDVIFGSTNTDVDLTASEIRNETEWLTSINIPLGRFSFIEGVIMPPGPDTEAGFRTGRMDRLSGGGRLYTKLGNIKIEGGYFFDQLGEEASSTDWENARHRPYFGLQGNLIADWYLAASTAFPVKGEVKGAMEEALNISGGLFYMINLNSISMLTLRLEGLYRPFQEWEEQAMETIDDVPVYALLLYPAIGYSPVDTVNLSVSSILSPVDKSAIIAAGVAWNMFEGFDLSCNFICNAGDPDDSFAWDRSADLWGPGTDLIDSAAVIVGLKYIY